MAPPTALGNALEALDHHLEAIVSDTTWSLHGRIGSALLWVCALDEAFWPNGAHSVAGYEDARDADPYGLVIPGLRRARDAVTHRLVQPSREGGLEYPLQYPLAYPDVWAPLSSLGTAKNLTRGDLQDRVYSSEVEGRHVREPLDRARKWLGWQVASQR